MAERLTSPVTTQRVDLGAAQLSDETDTTKWRVWDDRWSVPLGRAAATDDGLVFSISPGDWMVIGGPAPQGAVDLTHVRAMFRLSGPGARTLLEHLCAIDLGDQMMPNRGAARTLVAGVATELVRDDIDDAPSYLVLMSRSFARSVWDRLVAVSRPV